MLWDLSRIPHAMATFSQPDGCTISLVTAAELEASPHKLHILHQVSLAETASKCSWDLHSDNLLVERMGPVGRPIISVPAIVLLAVGFDLPHHLWFLFNRCHGTLPATVCKVFRTGWAVAAARVGPGTRIPRSQPARTGIWHPGLPQGSVLVLGEPGSAYVTKMPSLHPKLTTLVPLAALRGAVILKASNCAVLGFS